MNKKFDDPEQSKRFIETAKKVQADTDGEAFEKAIEAIARDSKKRLKIKRKRAT